MARKLPTANQRHPFDEHPFISILWPATILPAEMESLFHISQSRTVERLMERARTEYQQIQKGKASESADLR